VSCGIAVSRDGLLEAAKLGRVIAHSPEVRAGQAEKQDQHNAAAKAWNPSDQPDWLTEEAYREKIQPRLASIPVGIIASALDVSMCLNRTQLTFVKEGTFRIQDTGKGSHDSLTLRRLMPGQLSGKATTGTLAVWSDLHPLL
jgi:hypothetical protein